MPLAGGLGGWALAHPEFGSSVNHIPTKGGHHITDYPPGFASTTPPNKNILVTSLIMSSNRGKTRGEPFI